MLATATKGRGTAEKSGQFWPVWIGYEQAQELYGLSKFTWKRLCDEGEITFAFVGTRRLLEVRSIERFLQRRAEAGDDRAEADIAADEADS